MKPDATVRKGKRLFYVYYYDRGISKIFEGIPRTLAFKVVGELLDDLIKEKIIPSDGDILHIGISSDQVGVASHDEFLAEIKRKGITWEKPVDAGPEADVFWGEFSSDMPEHIATITTNAAQTHDCQLCPVQGFLCPNRKASFSRSLFNIEIAAPFN